MTIDIPRPAARRPNPEQGAVIAHGAGPIRIMAGAGTGKTFTITERVIRLIGDGLARPDQILALTFTNKAAAEMRDRISAACLAIGVPPDAEPVTALTYNSFGMSVVAEWGGLIGVPPNPSLLSPAQRWLILWDCLPRVDFRSIDLMHLRSTYASPLDGILTLSSRLQDELAGPEDLLAYLGAEGDDTLAPEEREKLADYARALQVFEAAKRAAGALDFGDQIGLAVRALGLREVREAYRDRYRFVLVDEYQDTNYAQSVLVQRLAEEFESRNVCVVGDIRQAIYRFRGAAPDNLLRFEEDFTCTTSYGLVSNYRSSRQILDAANALWTEREGDLQSADRREGAPVVACACEDRDSEWEWIARRIRRHHDEGVPYGDMAVLVRKGELRLQAWRGLMDRRIPAVMTGGTDLLRTPEVREILSYLRALTRPSDSISLAHIASSDSFGLDEAALYDLIGPLSKDRSLFDLLVERAADPAAPPDLRLFLATFQHLLADAATLSPARVVERIIGLRRGAYSDLQRANVYRFHTLADEFSSKRSRGSSLSAFVAYLNLLLAAPSDDDEATDVNAENAVAVMTVHAAKGLEWPVVFVATASEADFKLTNRGDILPLALRHPAAGMPRPDNFSEERKYKRALEAWVKGEHELEEQRILYVALTRARDHLYLSWHRLPLWYRKERVPRKALEPVLKLAVQEQFDRSDWEEEEQKELDPAAVMREFARRQARVWAGWRPEAFDGDLAEQLGEAWHAYLAEAELPAGGSSDAFLTGIRRWHVDRRHAEALLTRCLTPVPRPADADRRPVIEAPRTLSYSMLADYQSCGRKAYLRFAVGFPGEPRPTATGPGTAFHAAAETAAAAQTEGRDLTFEEILAGYTEAAAEAHGTERYTPPQREVEMLRAFWTSPERLATPLAIEQEFYWRVGPGYLHGFIDRIQRCPDGAIELVDFKTSTSALTTAEARESLQLIIYAFATREVLNLRLDRLTFVYPRLGTRVSVTYSEEELQAARRRIVALMESARTAHYDQVNTAHCRLCEYRLICPAAGAQI